jgi:hypothetical protein
MIKDILSVLISEVDVKWVFNMTHNIYSYC